MTNHIYKSQFKSWLRGIGVVLIISFSLGQSVWPDRGFVHKISPPKDQGKIGDRVARIEKKVNALLREADAIATRPNGDDEDYALALSKVFKASSLMFKAIQKNPLLEEPLKDLRRKVRERANQFAILDQASTRRYFGNGPIGSSPVESFL